MIKLLKKINPDPNGLIVTFESSQIFIKCHRFVAIHANFILNEPTFDLNIFTRKHSTATRSNKKKTLAVSLVKLKIILV